MSSIARAFTTRRVKLSVELAQDARERNAMQRSNTTRDGPRSDAGLKISGPVELIHTTNMLSYNAPDLPRGSTSSQASTKSSTNTDNDSDFAPGTAISSPPTSPDVAASELKRASSPEPNHLSSYFAPPAHAQAPGPAPVAASGLKRSLSPEPNHLSSYFALPAQAQGPAPAPVIPQRAPSRSKQSSVDVITRQKSTTRLQKRSTRSTSRSNISAPSPASSISAPPVTHMSTQSQSSFASPGPAPAPPVPVSPHAKPQVGPVHPFGAELAQVSEMAEEYGARGRKADYIDEEERELISRGLCKFSADVYLHDVEVLASTFFHDRDFRLSRQAPALWI